MADFADEVARILGLSPGDDSLDGGIEGALCDLLAERDRYEARVGQGEKVIVSDALRQLLLSQDDTLGRGDLAAAPEEDAPVAGDDN